MNAMVNACDVEDKTTFQRYSDLNLYLRNELNFWSVHGIMNTFDLLQSK